MNQFASTYAFIPFLVSLTIFFVLVYVFAQKGRSKVKRSFELYMFALFLVTQTEVFLRLPFPTDTTLVLYRIGIIGFCFTGILYLNFMYEVTEIKKDAAYYILLFIALAASSVIFLPGSDPALAQNSVRQAVIPPPQVAASLLLASVVPGAYSLFLCIRHLRRPVTERQRRIMILLIQGVAASVAVSLFFLAVIPIFAPAPLKQIYQFSSLCVLMHIFFLYKAVSRYHFLSINYGEVEQVSRSLFEHVSEAAVVFGTLGEQVQANSAARGIFGDKITEGVIRERIPSYRLDRDFESLRVETLQNGKPLHLQLSQSTISEQGGPFIGKLLLIRNVTEEVKSAEEQSRLEARLRQSEKMEAIGQLAGGVAHDFNNQLAGIMGYADLLYEELEHNPRLIGFTDGILNSAKRAADVTQQLLAFARKGHYLNIPVDLNRVVDETVAVLSHSIDKRIHIRREMSEEGAIAMGDPSQIQNAVLNLALNARDAMENGGTLTFRTSRVTIGGDRPHDSVDLPDGIYAKVSVEDTGIGIDPAILDRIFEPFFTTKPEGSGTGMGLAAVFGTAKNHGGAVTVESEVAAGSKFSIFIPCCGEETAEVIEPDAKISSKQSRGHILVIDDEMLVRDTVSIMLRRAGFTVESCDSGEAGLSYFQRHEKEVSLVILDLVMPGMSGEEVYKLLRQIAPDVRVLVSSGYSLNEMAQRILANGGSGFIQKPFRQTELSKKVFEIIGRIDPKPISTS